MVYAQVSNVAERIGAGVHFNAFVPWKTKVCIWPLEKMILLVMHLPSTYSKTSVILYLTPVAQCSVNDKLVCLFLFWSSYTWNPWPHSDSFLLPLLKLSSFIGPSIIWCTSGLVCTYYWESNVTVSMSYGTIVCRKLSMGWLVLIILWRMLTHGKDYTLVDGCRNRYVGFLWRKRVTWSCNMQLDQPVALTCYDEKEALLFLSKFLQCLILTVDHNIRFVTWWIGFMEKKWTAGICKPHWQLLCFYCQLSLLRYYGKLHVLLTRSRHTYVH